MNVVVTCSTGDQGLSLACCHDRDPSRLCCSPTRLEVLQHSNMVGSGADVPLQGSSVTRPQNRACTFRCTRLWAFPTFSETGKLKIIPSVVHRPPGSDI